MTFGSIAALRTLPFSLSVSLCLSLFLSFSFYQTQLAFLFVANRAGPSPPRLYVSLFLF